MIKFRNVFMLKKFCIFVILFISKCYSQTIKISKLDSLTEDYRYKGQYAEALKYNLNILKQYKKNNFVKGSIAANLNISEILASTNRYNESLMYLNTVKVELKNSRDPILYSRLYNEYGKVYFLLQLYNLSNKELNVAYKVLLSMPNKDIQRKLLYQNYLWKWSNYAGLGKTDSLFLIQGKLLRLPPESIGYIKIADRYLKHREQLDSVDYYLKKAIVLASNRKFPLHHTALALMNLGKLYSIKNENEKALTYYFESLAIVKKINRKDYISRNYRELSNIYKKLNNNDKSEEYYRKYSFLNDSINNDEKVALYSIVDELAELEKNNGSNTIIIVLIFLLCCVCIIWGFFKVRNKEIMKKNETKINDHEYFNEIIEMADKGNPFFLAKFKNRYPDFHEKLHKHCENLTEHDIKFCIYMRLNLNSKQILQYENITLSAIEMKKYRLKKKLNLPSDTKLSTWILEI